MILGGGPAGLTAAYRLTGHGYRVTIIDRRPLLGGARTSEDLCDDPEPFTILGCHHATQALLHSLHPDPQQPAETEIPLEFRLHDNSLVQYPRTWVPAPLHTWVNLLKFAGFPWNERWRLASWLERLWEGDERCPPIWSSAPPMSGSHRSDKARRRARGLESSRAMADRQ